MTGVKTATVWSDDRFAVLGKQRRMQVSLVLLQPSLPTCAAPLSAERLVGRAGLPLALEVRHSCRGRPAMMTN